MKKKNTLFKPKFLATTIGAGIATVATSVTAHANTFNSYTGTSGNKIVSGAKEFFGTIGTWGGGLYAAAAIFTLILAIRNEDNEGRNKALLNLVAAIALLSTGVIIKLFFTD